MNAEPIRKASALLLFVAFSCVWSSGTELVMVIEKHRVFLAADSLLTNDSGQEPSKQCKIHQSDTLFYAISGLAFDLEVGFNPDKLIAKRRRNIDTAEALDGLDVSFIGSLQKVVALLKTEAPARYDQIIQGTAPIETIFVVETFGKPRGYVKEFGVVNGKVVAAPARNCFGGHVIEEGERCESASSMATLMPFLRPLLRTDDAVTIIHKIVEAAQSARPTEVAPPISILDLEPTGPRWSEQGLCPDIKKATAKRKATPKK
jgi:hypothetical protein